MEFKRGKSTEKKKSDALSHNNLIIKIPDIRKLIQQYIDSVKRGEYLEPEGDCPRCGETPPEFKLHDKRRRLICFIEDLLVCVMEIILVRWKCTLCKRTFTWYPAFVLPYKWYVRSDILELSRRYLESTRLSYDRVLREGNSRVGYENRPNSFLWPKTIWRWVIWL